MEYITKKLVYMELQDISLRTPITNMSEIYESIIKDSKNMKLIISKLLNTKISINNKSITPFYEACSMNKGNAFACFCDFDLDFNITDDEGASYLHIIIKIGNIHMIKKLLELKANCDIVANNGENALMVACSKDTPDIALLMIEVVKFNNTIENQKALSIACQKNYIEVVTKLADQRICKILLYNRLKQ